MSKLGYGFGLFISADFAGVCPYALGFFGRLGGDNAAVKGMSRSIQMLLAACSQTRIPVTVFIIFPNTCICIVIGAVGAVIAISADVAECLFGAGSRAALMGVTRFGNILPVFFLNVLHLISSDSVGDNNGGAAAVGGYFKDICKVASYLILYFCRGVGDRSRFLCCVLGKEYGFERGAVCKCADSDICCT